MTINHLLMFLTCTVGRSVTYLTMVTVVRPAARFHHCFMHSVPLFYSIELYELSSYPDNPFGNNTDGEISLSFFTTEVGMNVQRRILLLLVFFVSILLLAIEGGHVECSCSIQKLLLCAHHWLLLRSRSSTSFSSSLHTNT